jgi:hypothetical protein
MYVDHVEFVSRGGRQRHDNQAKEKRALESTPEVRVR